jgi:palmitoyltransferase ZDHHC9/14/18
LQLSRIDLTKREQKRGMRDMYVVPPPPDPIAGATVDASVTGDDGEDQLRTYQAWKGSNVS